jgi:hypothetical protein
MRKVLPVELAPDPGNLLPAMSLLERFQWVMKARGTNPSRWSEDAGLSRTTVRGILKKIKEGEDPNPTQRTMEALAGAAGVSVAWLISGEGAPDDLGSPPAPSAVVTRDGELPQGGYRRFGDLPGWAEAEAAARRTYRDLLPDFAWEAAAGQAGAVWPTEVTPQTVYRFAKAWFDQATEQELIERERAEVERQIAAYRATDKAKSRGHG